jgi:ligand-binding SRPBCC domain-containing protein
MLHFVKESLIDASRERVFAFHQRPDAFALLQPPWENTRIIQPPTSLASGTRVVLETKVGLFWVTIEAEHVAYVENERFEDVMRRGPFAHWHHKHLFIAHGSQCILRDEIDYELPLGPLGRLFGARFAQHKLERMFAFRHEVTARATQ